MNNNYKIRKEIKCIPGFYNDPELFLYDYKYIISNNLDIYVNDNSLKDKFNKVSYFELLSKNKYIPNDRIIEEEDIFGNIGILFFNEEIIKTNRKYRYINDNYEENYKDYEERLKIYYSTLKNDWSTNTGPTPPQRFYDLDMVEVKSYLIGFGYNSIDDIYKYFILDYSYDTVLCDEKLLNLETNINYFPTFKELISYCFLKDLPYFAKYMKFYNNMQINEFIEVASLVGFNIENNTYSR